MEIVPRINPSWLKSLTIWSVVDRALKHYGDYNFHIFYHDLDIQIEFPISN